MSTDQDAISGRLTKDRFGASMPVDAPYYQSPPFYYRDARSLTIAYETDADAAADLLPEGVDLPRPAQALLMILDYPSSTFGPYHEAVLGIQCSWEGVGHSYIAHIVVDTAPPLVGGREIWGFPKKIADIDLRQENEFVCGSVERPRGMRLVTATMRPEQPMDMSLDPGGGLLALRVIPSPEADQPPSLAQLIQVPMADRLTHEAWTGPATLSYDAQSALDPWHGLPVRQVLGSVYTRFDFTLPHGRVLRSY
jgi:acetoacetate decarboxylase